ncbi:hypothetical protein ILUMI_17560 [Ignelater luminosus]|uniref:Mutator-like transposase domain-containing protein n=1 Tax=Ignelater luminosus TaxID=2038154 RepID=A0A8K0G7T3_IGNLU|nr:hypothetical protein ILUMI_17560 [Ignelater luminosus]
MKNSVEEERAMAISEGNFEDAVPFITIVVDGGWAKLPYGHEYASMSGVACMIGEKTQKLLEEICPRKHSNEQNHVVLLQHSNTFKEIHKCDDNVVRKTNHLKGNYAERYMSLVAKFSGSKRVNYSTGGSYSRRCFGAALAYNSGPSWHLSMIKNKPLNTLCARRERL